MRTHVKICCIQSIEEADIALKYGACAIGLVSEMPSGPGVISEEKIQEIAKWAPSKLKTVLLTAHQEADKLIEQHNFCGTDIIQLVDSQAENTYLKLLEKLTGTELMQVIHVLDENSVEEAIKVSEYVDYILLDSGNPNLGVKELGGTGRTHNWELSRQIVDEINVPVFLAGGLNPDNVSDAISAVRPFGVDICSGLRIDTYLVEDKVREFMVQVEG